MNILVALMEKAHNIKEQMHNVDREIKTLRKNQREILEIIIHRKRQRVLLMGSSMD